jgi:hypothetical protein
MLTVLYIIHKRCSEQLLEHSNTTRSQFENEVQEFASRFIEVQEEKKQQTQYSTEIISKMKEQEAVLQQQLLDKDAQIASLSLCNG